MNEPKLQNNVKDLDPIMQELLAMLGKKFAFKTTECLRSLVRQKWLVANGKSWTRKSRHLLAQAADLFPIPTGYKDARVFVAMHDYWDKIVTAYHKPGFIVKPEPRIGRDMGHFGIIITKASK